MSGASTPIIGIISLVAIATGAAIGVIIVLARVSVAAPLAIVLSLAFRHEFGLG